MDLKESAKLSEIHQFYPLIYNYFQMKSLLVLLVVFSPVLSLAVTQETDSQPVYVPFSPREVEDVTQEK